MPGVVSTSIARGARRAATRRRRPRRSSAPAALFARDLRGQPLDARWRVAGLARRRPDVAGRPLRAPQGPHHGLVGRDDRRSCVPPRPLRARGGACRRRRSAAATARTRPATACAPGCSRTSRSTSSAPTARRASSTDHGRPGRARPGAGHRAAGGRSSRRRGEHRPLHAVGSELIEGLIAGARDALAEARDDGQTEYLRSSRTGARRLARARTTSASTCTTCRRSRTGSPRSSAVRRGS